jgi:hypothetical protein
VKPSAPVTPLADPRRAMPRAAAARRAVAEAAVNSLAAEQRRLAALGEEWALARTGYQLRYWRFVRALVGLDLVSEPRAARVVAKSRRAA